MSHAWAYSGEVQFLGISPGGSGIRTQKNLRESPKSRKDEVYIYTALKLRGPIYYGIIIIDLSAYALHPIL